MFGFIAPLGTEFERSWHATAGIALPWAPDSVSNMIIAGVGGSAAAGDYLGSLVARSSPVPLRVVRGYGLPAYAGPSTLVVIASYSGETEEAIACYRHAGAVGAMRVVITRGGTLGRMAASDGVSTIPIVAESPPRAALPHILAALLRIASGLNLMPVSQSTVAAAAAAHEHLVASQLGSVVACEGNPAKRFAQSLGVAMPFVMSAETLGPAARRAKNQFAENAKTIAAFEVLPEAGHNLVVGLDGAPGGPSLAVCTFESPLDEVGDRRRFDAIESQFTDAGIPFTRLRTSGISPLADLLEATAYGDYISCYLAMLKGFDPTPVEQITRLKRALSSTGETVTA